MQIFIYFLSLCFLIYLNRLNLIFKRAKYISRTDIKTPNDYHFLSQYFIYFGNCVYGINIQSYST